MDLDTRDSIIRVLLDVTIDDIDTVTGYMSDEDQQKLPRDVFSMCVVWIAANKGLSEEGVLRSIGRMPDAVLEHITRLFAPHNFIPLSADPNRCEHCFLSTHPSR